MRGEHFYLDLVGGWGGIWLSPVRAVLSVLAGGYRLGVQRRNRRFDDGRSEIVRLPVPVISVGNMTTGGTGKTPLVLEIARRCIRHGRRPAVVARGYKAGRKASPDELHMISEQLPGVPCIAKPDRVAGGYDAMKLGADVIVLDDGFQHRRLARDADIVVVDATNPFGFGHLLPRGLLREPVEGLRRADLVVVSRCDLVENGAVDQLVRRINDVAPGPPVVRGRHRPIGLCDIRGTPRDERYQRAIAFAAIGNPRAFARTIEQMGLTVVANRWWPDHHKYGAKDIAELVKLRQRFNHDVVLTTRKDAVKLRALAAASLEPLRMVDIEMELLDGGDAVLEQCLDEALGRSIGFEPVPAPIECSS